MRNPLHVAAGLAVLSFGSCGPDDGPGTEADRVGVGAQCSSTDECTVDGEDELGCLEQFKGGYCGLADCTLDEDCPLGSACVTHDDGANYCFLVCQTKAQCNLNRSPALEANCSSSTTLVEGTRGPKVCIPPSGS
jgi:hypothetical protein